MSLRVFIKHLRHYIPLLTILLLGFLGFLLFSYDRSFQMALVIAMSLGYFSWGVVNHMIHKDLTLSIFFEYLAYSVFGATVVLTLLSQF